MRHPHKRKYNTWGPDTKLSLQQNQSVENAGSSEERLREVVADLEYRWHRRRIRIFTTLEVELSREAILEVSQIRVNVAPRLPHSVQFRP